METLFDCLLYLLFGGVLVASVWIIADFGWHVCVDDDSKAIGAESSNFDYVVVRMSDVCENRNKSRE